MPFTVERKKVNGRRLRVIRCLGRHPGVGPCQATYTARDPLDRRVRQFLCGHRRPDDPMVWDLLLELFPENRRKIERRMLLAAERRLLGGEG